MRKAGIFVFLLLVSVSCIQVLSESLPVVTFDVQGKGRAPAYQIVTVNSRVTKPSDPDCPGYVFTGWYTDRDCTAEWDFDNPVPSSMTLYAGWRPLAWLSVSFENGGHGEKPNDQRVIEGSPVIEPDPEKMTATDYNFAGWYSDRNFSENSRWDFNTPVTGSLTLYAKWIHNSEVTVNFDAQGHGVAPSAQTITVGDTVEEPSALYADGYIFIGWFSDPQFEYPWDFGTSVSMTLTLYACWAAEISFNMNGHGTAPDNQAVWLGRNAAEPEIPVADGFLFAGWYSDAECTDRWYFDSSVTHRVTLYAKWTPVYADVTVVFDAKGHGAGPESQTIKAGEVVTKPSDPSASGYVFTGWYSDSDCYHLWDFDSSVATDMTVYAGWGVDVSFNMKGHGRAPENQIVITGHKISEPDSPSLAGYVFMGWYSDSECRNKWNFNTSVSSATTLYAGWGVTVSFSMNGHGTAPAAQAVLIGNKITQPAAPSETGYVFMGWFADSECRNKWNFNTSVSSATTLYAGWGVTVSFNMNGHGTAPAAQTVLIGNPVSKPSAPVATGYIFLRWYSDSGCKNEWDFTAGVTAASILYAGWGVEVSFNMKGHGTAPAKQAVLVGTAISEPDPPSESGYVFMGWYSDSGCKTKWNFSTEITAIRTLYAGWGVTVSFYIDGYATAPDDQVVLIGNKIKKPANPSSAGYLFTGWYSDFQTTDLWDFNSSPDKRTILYAGWTVESENYHPDAEGKPAKHTFPDYYLMTDNQTGEFAKVCSVCGYQKKYTEIEQPSGKTLYTLSVNVPALYSNSGTASFTLKGEGTAKKVNSDYRLFPDYDFGGIKYNQNKSPVKWRIWPLYYSFVDAIRNVETEQWFVVDNTDPGIVFYRETDAVSNYVSSSWPTENGNAALFWTSLEPALKAAFSRDILKEERELVGVDFWDYDNDGKFRIVFYDFGENSFTSDRLDFSGTLGAYAPADTTPGASKSNQSDMFYVNLRFCEHIFVLEKVLYAAFENAGEEEATAHAVEFCVHEILYVLTHEYLHYLRDVVSKDRGTYPENSMKNGHFAEEGLANYIAYKMLNGEIESHVEAWLRKTDVSRPAINADDKAATAGSPYISYGGGALFFGYIEDKYGFDKVKDYVHYSSLGKTDINTATYSILGKKFPEVYTDFLVSYIDSIGKARNVFWFLMARITSDDFEQIINDTHRVTNSSTGVSVSNLGELSFVVHKWDQCPKVIKYSNTSGAEDMRTYLFFK